MRTKKLLNGVTVFIVLALFWIGPMANWVFTQRKTAKLFELKIQHPEMADKILDILELRNVQRDYLSYYHWLLIALTVCILCSNEYGKTSKRFLGILVVLSLLLFFLARRLS